LIGFATVSFPFVSLRASKNKSDIERLPIEMHYRMYQTAHDFFARPKNKGATPQGYFNTLVHLVKNIPLFPMMFPYSHKLIGS
jgi:hypothetical protein